ncbi:MAG: methyltransferase domain-containing protein [Phycisphaerae bacterium]|nr:methyltransferase domain-containing protein [Phycisphaerae bacterium]
MLDWLKKRYWRLREWARQDARDWLIERLPRQSRLRWRAAQQEELDWWRRFLESGRWREHADPKPLPGETWLEHRRSVMGRWQADFDLPLSDWIGQDDLVLDLGCGPYSLVRQGRVIGLDPLAGRYGELVDLAADRDVTYVAASGESLPLADERFDVVWSRNVIDHVRDPAAFVAEAMRVLRASGRFLLTFDVVSEGGVAHPHGYIDETWVRRTVRGRIIGTYRWPSDEMMVVVQKG